MGGLAADGEDFMWGLCMQHNMLHPLDPFLRPVMEAAVQLGLLTAELLSERCNKQSLQNVADQVKHLQELRYVVSLVILLLSELHSLHATSASM